MNTNTNDMSAVSGSSHVATLIERGGKKLSSLIAELVVKSEEVAAGPVTTLSLMREIYTDTVLRTEFPRLGSKDTDDDIGNNYAEAYKSMEPNAAGELKSKSVNFFTKFYQGTDDGKETLFQYEQTVLATSKDPSKAQVLYQKMENHELENLKRKLKFKLTQGRNYIRKAVGVWHVWQDLLEHTDAEGKPYVILDYTTNNVYASKYPLDLVDNMRRGKFQPMSVGDVLKLDVQEAIDMGGNLYDNLIKQLSRDTNTNKVGKYPIPANTDDAANCLVAFLAYIDIDSEDGQNHVNDLKKMMTQKKGGEELIENVGALLGNLKGMWTPALQGRYEALLEKKLEAGDTDDKPAVKAA